MSDVRITEIDPWGREKEISHPAFLLDLAARLAVLEADNAAMKTSLCKSGMHGDGCSYHPYAPSACDCWLSEEAP